MNGEHCKMCKFYRPDQTAPGSGLCTVDPPRVFLKGSDFVSVYPTVYDNAHCRMFLPDHGGTMYPT